jgi:hypothetical protein
MRFSRLLWLSPLVVVFAVALVRGDRAGKGRSPVHVSGIGPRMVSNQTGSPIVVYGSGLRAAARLHLGPPWNRSVPLVVEDDGHAFARLPADLNLPDGVGEASPPISIERGSGAREATDLRLTVVNDKGFPDPSRMVGATTSPLVFVLSKTTDTLWAVEPTTGRVRSLTTDDGPTAMATWIDETGREWVVVAHEYTEALLLYDAAHPDQATRRLPAPRGVSALAIDSKRHIAVVGEHVGDTVLALDLLADGRPLWQTRVAPNTRALAWTGNTVTAVSMQTGEIEVMDGDSGEHRQLIAPRPGVPIIGGHTQTFSRYVMGAGLPRDLVWSPKLQRLFVSNAGPDIGPNPDRMEVTQNGGVAVIDVSTGQFVRHVGLDHGVPEQMLLDDARGLLYVTDPALGVVHVLDTERLATSDQSAAHALLYDAPIAPPDGFPTARPTGDYGITPPGQRLRAGVEVHSGPTALALAAGGKGLHVLGRFTGVLSTLDVSDARRGVPQRVAQLQVVETLAQRERRLGQILYFADMGRSAMSCEACHPGGNVGGLMFAKTHPMRIYRSSSILGDRDTPPFFNPPSSPTLRATAIRVGGRNRYHNPDPSDSEVHEIAYYASTFTAPPNPFLLPSGALPDTVALPDGATGRPRQGMQLFARARCMACHPSPLFALDQDEATRGTFQAVGTPALFPLRRELQEQGRATFTPPSLLGVWDLFPLFNTGAAGYDVREDGTVARSARGPLRQIIESPHGGAPAFAGVDADDLLAYLMTL